MGTSVRARAGRSQNPQRPAHRASRLCDLNGAPQFRQVAVRELERRESNAVETPRVEGHPEREVGPALGDKEGSSRLPRGADEQRVEPTLGLGT
ncbi:MAG TPA: hypothetical protein VHQ03_00425, partial [Candidatus Dormibacteraeota bacterium]|nr:hypothetical protein [Candidatus Dormibacteraeota bacterium]